MKQLAYDLEIAGETIADPVGGDFAEISDFFTGAGGQPRLLAYSLTFAGLLLLIYFIWGGLEVLLSTGEPQKIKSGSDRILHAIVGFIIIFTAFWIIQIIEFIFGIEILG